MADNLTDRQKFDLQTRQVLLGVEGVVFPEGHPWAGLTKAQSEYAVRKGFESGPAYLASLQPAVLMATVDEVKFSAPDTGKLDAKKK